MPQKQKKAVKAVTPVKACIVIATVFTVAATAAGIFVYQHDKSSMASDANIVSAQKHATEACMHSIHNTLHESTGVAKVYDSRGTLLFLLRGSNGVESARLLPPQFASDIQQKLLGGLSPVKIDLGLWSKSHTILGGLSEKRTMQDWSASSLGFKTVEVFCEYTQTMLPDIAKFVVGAALDDKYSTDVLISYCASVGKFGRFQGVVAACEQWFNKDLGRLNEWQLHYLGYAFNNSEASWDDFVSKHPDWTGGAETPEAFGFEQNGGDPYWLLRQRIADELNVVLGDDWSLQNFSVKLEINSALQSGLQQGLDQGLKSSITLGADGQTVVDGVVGVVDSHTGFVVAYVDGRSVNSSTWEFALPRQSCIGDYREAAEVLSSDSTLTYASLMSYENSLGLLDYVSFGELVGTGKLSLIGRIPEYSTSCKIWELLEFGTSMFVSGKPRFVSQVQDSLGNTIYSAPSVNDIRQVTPNPDLRCLLVGATEGAAAHYYADSEVGVSFGEFTSEYVFGAIIGTNAQGYGLSDDDMDLCTTTALSLAKIVTQQYPHVPADIDDTGIVAEKVAQSYMSNVQIVTSAVDTWVKSLREQPITSVETRAEFENSYAQYSKQLYAYGGLISTELFSELQARLDAVRIERTDELMQFIA